MWTLDSGSTGSLPTEECFSLLTSEGRGLVNLNRHPLPTPVRVGFLLQGADLVLRPDSLARVRGLLAFSDVTLQVDAHEAGSHNPWRVVVTGHVDEDLVLHPTDVCGYRLVASQAC